MTILDRTFIYKDERPKYALEKSVFYGHKEISKLMIEWGSQRPSANMRLDLGYAVTAEDTNTLHEYWLRKPQDEKMEDLRTVLHLGSKRGKVKCIEFSLELGVPIESIDDESGCTALGLAVTNGQSEAVKCLPDAGADASTTHLHTTEDGDGYKRSLLYGAVTSMCTFVKRLDFLVDNFTLAHTPAGIEDSDLVFLEKHLRIWMTKDPRPPQLLANSNFIEAIRRDADHPKIIELLLERESDMSERGDYGQTLLHLSVISKGRVDAILRHMKRNRLVKMDIDIRDSHGRTPLHYVAAACNVEVVNLLIQSGADVMLKDDRGATTLHFAVNSPSCIRVVVENGCNINDSPR